MKTQTSLNREKSYVWEKILIVNLIMYNAANGQTHLKKLTANVARFWKHIGLLCIIS